MPNMTLRVLFLLIFTKHVYCECIESYMTICENLSDLESSNFTQISTHLVVKAQNPGMVLQKYPAGFYLLLMRATRLRSAIIIGHFDGIHSCPFGSARLNQLEYLSITNDVMKEITPCSFPELPKLKKLSLVNNSVELVPKSVFSNLDPEEIDLSLNQITVIEDGVFDGNKTKVIILTKNKITYIAPRSFPTSLEILMLDHNNLWVIQEEVIDYLVNIKILNFNHNKMRQMPNITKLRLIENLDISYNDIRSITTDTFDKLNHLRFLDLSHNKIVTTDLLMKFNSLDQHWKISLAFNHLQKLNVQFIAPSSYVKKLILHGNPWLCHEWNQIQLKLNGTHIKQPKCDLELIASGLLPYCVVESNDVTVSLINELQNLYKQQKNRFDSCVVNNLDLYGE